MVFGVQRPFPNPPQFCFEGKTCFFRNPPVPYAALAFQKSDIVFLNLSFFPMVPTSALRCHVPRTLMTIYFKAGEDGKRVPKRTLPFSQFPPWSARRGYVVTSFCLKAPFLRDFFPFLVPRLRNPVVRVGTPTLPALFQIPPRSGSSYPHLRNFTVDDSASFRWLCGMIQLSKDAQPFPRLWPDKIPPLKSLSLGVFLPLFSKEPLWLCFHDTRIEFPNYNDLLPLTLTPFQSFPFAYRRRCPRPAHARKHSLFPFDSTFFFYLVTDSPSPGGTLLDPLWDFF